MLKVDNIDVYYGAIHAIKGISIEVPKGEIVTLVGSNGAGKSTTLRTISGLMKPKNGTILFEDKNIVGVRHIKLWVWAYVRFRKEGMFLQICRSGKPGTGCIPA